MNAAYFFAASSWAVRRAEYWRRLGDYSGARQEAMAELRHHVKCREKARILAWQAKAAES